MSRFVETTRGLNRTKNYEGAESYKLPKDLELYSYVVTSMLSPKFYGPNVEDQLVELRQLIRENDVDFVAKLAIYARERMNLRTIPLVLAVELAKFAPSNVVRKTTKRIIQRADELTEILGYYAKANNITPGDLKKIRRALLQGIGDAFLKFDEYQFAKYNRQNDIKMKDALRLSHPVPMNDDQSRLFKKIVDDDLQVPYTWEVQLTQAGQAGKSKREVWEELIDSNRLPYMAMLRNLRNFIQEGVSMSHIEKVAHTLADPQKVQRSKQMPFRFVSAFKAFIGVRPTRGWHSMGNGIHIPNDPKTLVLVDAIDKALNESIANVEFFQPADAVLVACDVSGSMRSTISEKSTVEMYDIGLVLGCLLKNRCKYVTTGLFGDTWKPVTLPKNSILQSLERLYSLSNSVGFATHAFKVLDWVNETGRDYDKICFFSDGQMYGDRNAIIDKSHQFLRNYPKSRIYIFDLQGYGTSPLNIYHDRIHFISGWSNDIFKILKAYEDGSSAIEEIKNIEL